MKNWGPLQFLEYLMPWKYFREHVVPATNAALKESNVKRMITLAELKQWLGIWFLMSLYPQYLIEDFFFAEKKEKKKKEG